MTGTTAMATVAGTGEANGQDPGGTLNDFSVSGADAVVRIGTAPKSIPDARTGAQPSAVPNGQRPKSAGTAKGDDSFNAQKVQRALASLAEDCIQPTVSARPTFAAIAGWLESSAALLAR